MVTADLVNNLLVYKLIDTVALIFLAFIIHRNSALKSVALNGYYFSIGLIIIVSFLEYFTSYQNIYLFLPREALMVLNTFGFSLSLFIPIALSTIIYKPFDLLVSLMYVPAAVNLILVLCSIKTGWIFYIDKSTNMYFRGKYFWVYSVCAILVLLLFLLCNIRKYVSVTRENKVLLLLLGICIVLGCTIQILNSSIFTSWHCVSLGLILYYIFISEVDYKYDKVTGMYTRRAFEKDLKRFVNLRETIVVMIDVNDFKHVNDKYGHLKGDECLYKLAKIIRYNFKDSGYYYRYGGDEFCIISKMGDEDEVNRCIEKVKEDIIKGQRDDEALPSLSFGCSKYSRDEDITLLDTIEKADEEMYLNKKSMKEKL